jgi:hypothetical protein
MHATSHKKKKRRVPKMNIQGSGELGLIVTGAYLMISSPLLIKIEEWSVEQCKPVGASISDP